MGQMVVFKLSDQSFAVPITDIQEILPYEDATEVPYAPKFVKGITDIRDEIVPIIELGIKFRLKRRVETSEQKIMVFNLGSEKVGILVDDVTEVIPIPDSHIKKPPGIVAHRVLEGVAKIHNHLIIILNPQHILDKEDFDLLQKLSSEEL